MNLNNNFLKLAVISALLMVIGDIIALFLAISELQNQNLDK